MGVWKKNLKKAVAGGFVAATMLLGAPGFEARSESLSDEALSKALQKVLRDRPDIVLDVLRKNSEAVLDIAQQGSNLRRKRSLEKQWDEDIKTAKDVRLEGRPVLGPANARVRIVAFSDFTCHFCQQASEVVDSLLREFGKDVCLVFKNLPLEEKGVSNLASAYFVAVSQQDESKAWALYRKLFADRERLVAEGEEYLKNAAEGLGVDMKRLGRDLRGKKVGDILKEDLQDARKLGVEGTPYFLVNNIVVRGALPLDLFRSAVQKALETKGSR